MQTHSASAALPRAQAAGQGEGPPSKAFQATTTDQWSSTDGQMEPVRR